MSEEKRTVDGEVYISYAFEVTCAPSSLDSWALQFLLLLGLLAGGKLLITGKGRHRARHVQATNLYKVHRRSVSDAQPSPRPPSPTPVALVSNTT